MLNVLCQDKILHLNNLLFDTGMQQSGLAENLLLDVCMQRLDKYRSAASTLGEDGLVIELEYMSKYNGLMKTV